MLKFLQSILASGSRGGSDGSSTADCSAARSFTVDRYRVSVDMSAQKLALDLPVEESYDGGEDPLSPTLSEAGASDLVSASVLAQKAKQFDDGLYAAVDMAAQRGAGRFAGKTELLRALADRLAAVGAPHGQLAAIVLAAGELGGHKPATIPFLAESVRQRLHEFNADELRSKPIGFYTWSSELAAIFRQDRMLATPTRGDEAAGVARLLAENPSLHAIYADYLDLVSRLTNPLAGADLRPLVQGTGQPAGEFHFFPPSRAHETDLVKAMSGDDRIPEDFNLADEMIRRIRAGKLSLQPGPQSGWYDWQTWALEPLVIPERMPEAERLRADDEYRRQLLELFKGIIALTRETHIKQLEIPTWGAAYPFDDETQSRSVVTVRPELTAEPLPTYYARRAESYRFVRQLLVEIFGVEGLEQMRRLTAAGPVEESLSSELLEMERIFDGAAATVVHQLGMRPPPGPEAEAFDRFAGNLEKDRDVGADARMMVPVFFDVQRRQTKVWAFLGWSTRAVEVSFAERPAVRVFEAASGRPVDADIAWESRWGRLAYPVTAEVYVDRILDRDEFRRLCDDHQTRSAILRAVSG